LLEETQQPRTAIDWLEVHPGVRRQRVFVSARTGQGLADLRQAIAEHALARLNAEASASPTLLPDGSFAVAPLPQPDAADATPPHEHA
jgi:GTP-binding protein HflX